MTVTDIVEQGVNIDLTNLTAAQGFIIQGDDDQDAAGSSVSNAGDVNGDGFDDLIVGARNGDDGGSAAGEAYVVFGSASGFGSPDASGRQVIDLSTLTAAQGFIIQGDAGGDRAGFSISSAGDVNGDGFDDLIVGAPLGDDGGTSAGEAYVVFGSASGFGSPDASGRQVIDLTNLTAAQGFIIQGDFNQDNAGEAVSSAGDINGDGFDDLIVGASGGDDGGFDMNAQSGEAYVVFGSASGFGSADASGRQVIDLSTLTAAQGFIIQGDAEGDLAGFSVSGAGDVDGDGFDDLIVGAADGDDGGTSGGEAYVVFGSASGFRGNAITDSFGRQVIDLTNLRATQGFIIQADTANDRLGESVSSAGDVNGDGFDDLIVGAPFGDGGGSNSGEAYVVFGTANGFGAGDATGRQVIDLSTLNRLQGFVIQADAGGDRTGVSVSSAGDVNGDGFDDLIVGAPNGDGGGNNAGVAFVLFGSGNLLGTPDGALRQVVDLSNLTPAQGFRIQGDEATDAAGFSVSSAGDVNGDGFDDLIVGAPSGDDGGSSAGEAYVIFGGATGTESTVAVNAVGTTGADNLVGNAGDDTLIGNGGADVLRGGAGNDTISIGDLVFAAIDGGTGNDTLALSGSNLFLDLTITPRPRIDSIETIDLSGSGDNSLIVDRLAILEITENRANGEATLIVNGNAGDSVTAADFVANGTQVVGGVTYNLFENGNANLLVAQDVNVVVADIVDPGGNNAPVFTSAASASVAENQTAAIDADASDADRDTLTYTISGTDAALFAIDAASGVVTFLSPPDFENPGDANGDNVYEFVVSASDGTNTTDQAVSVTVTDIVEQGVNIDLTNLTAAQGFIIQGDDGLDNAGSSVSNAGDVNGDGFDDLIVGARNGEDGGGGAGEAYVVFGSASGFGSPDASGRQVIDLSTLTAAQGFIIQGDTAVDLAGESVSGAGDVNGDGFDDLIVGAPLGDDGGSSASSNSGEAYVVFGSASGFGSTDASGRQVIDLTTLTAAQGFVIQGHLAQDFAGQSVSSAGDINGDGFDDLIVGARFGDGGGSNAGEAYVVFGSASGFGSADASGRQVIDLSTLTAAQGFIIQGDTVNDLAGFSVSGAGDVDGDGFDDLIVGAANGSDGGPGAGEAYVVFGSASGFRGNAITDSFGRQVIDLTNLSATQGFIIQADTANDRLGESVSSAGDVNGDGFDDLIVGAPFGDDGGSNSGEAYVVFGTANGFGASDATGRQVIDLSTLNRLQGFVIQGDADGDRTGVSVSSAGDVNGDGFDDLIVGASNGDGGGNNAGVAYVLFGSGSLLGTPDGALRQVFDLSNLTPAQGFRIQGDEANDAAGGSVSSAGDINGDGFDDLIIGASGGDDGGNSSGEAYVIFGGATGTESTVAVNAVGTTGADNLVGNSGDDTLIGNGGADVLRGGAGNDTISIDDLAFAAIDGGNGSDTLALSGADLTLDLTTTPRPRIDSIETIDLSGSGNNSLIVDRLAILEITETRANGEATLIVNGNTGDSVTAADFVANGTQVVGGVTYNLFENGNANLLVAQDVSVVVNSTISTTNSVASSSIATDDSQDLNIMSAPDWMNEIHSEAGVSGTYNNSADAPPGALEVFVETMDSLGLDDPRSPASVPEVHDYIS